MKVKLFNHPDIGVRQAAELLRQDMAGYPDEVLIAHLARTTNNPDGEGKAAIRLLIALSPKYPDARYYLSLVGSMPNF